MNAKHHVRLRRSSAVWLGTSRAITAAALLLSSHASNDTRGGACGACADAHCTSLSVASARSSATGAPCWSRVMERGRSGGDSGIMASCAVKWSPALRASRTCDRITLNLSPLELHMEEVVVEGPEVSPAISAG